MNIQAEKIELIRLIMEVNSEQVLKKIKHILKPVKDSEQKDSAHISPSMQKRLEESMAQITDGKAVKVNLDAIWK